MSAYHGRIIMSKQVEFQINHSTETAEICEPMGPDKAPCIIVVHEWWGGL